MPDLSFYQERLENMAGRVFGSRWRQGVAGDNQAVELEVGQALYGCVLENKPRNVVELGTGRGYSTSWLLLAALKNTQDGSPCKVFSLDIAHFDRHIWDEINLPIENLVYLNNETVSTALLPSRIDLLFHDSSHNPQEVVTDLQTLLPRIPIGGFILIHDVLYSPNMGEAVVAFFDSMPDQFDYQEVSQGCGLGIAKRIGLPQVPVESAPRRLASRSKPIKRKKRAKPSKQGVVA